VRTTADVAAKLGISDADAARELRAAQRDGLYGYFRGGGYAPDAAGLAALGSFLFPTLGRFLLPFIALVLLLVTGEINGSILLVGGISLAVTAAAGIAGYYFLREERSARRLGAKLQRPLSWILVKSKRDPIEDGAGRARNSVPTRSPCCARGGRWGRSGRSRSLPGSRRTGRRDRRR
jgi:hypothetical protein